MGGNALAVQCIRANREVYEAVKTDVIARLRSYLDLYPIPEAPEKSDFGDLDILYTLDEVKDVTEIVRTVFNPAEIKRNGTVNSFSYKLDTGEYFQVDLIFTTNPTMSLFYFSYGDYGSIVGRMVKPLGLSFGEAGLWTTYQGERIVLSTEPATIADYLNLNYDEWKSGFPTKVALFEHLVRCKFFTPAVFRSENLNHQYNKRTKKRKLFVEFQAYVAGSPVREIVYDDDYISVFNKGSDRDAIDIKVDIIKLYQEKYSGHMFVKYVEPFAINRHKEAFRKNVQGDFDEWLRNNTVEQIQKAIERYFADSAE
jgi:hypothetical protein